MKEEDEDLERRLHAVQLAKLEMEIETLRKESPFWKTKLPFFTLLVATIGTMATIWFNIYTASAARQKERELRVKEVGEKWDVQFRADLLQLLNFPNNETQTAPTATFLFRDMKSLVESKPGANDAMKAKRRAEVASLLTELFRSPEFDLSKPRNINLEHVALEEWDAYGVRLLREPRDNIRILYNYYLALQSLHRQDPTVTERATLEVADCAVKPDEYSQSNAASREDSTLRIFGALAIGYFAHLKRLKESSAAEDKKQRDVHRAFCWYRDATGNRGVSRDLFCLSDAEAQRWWEACEEVGGAGVEAKDD